MKHYIDRDDLVAEINKRIMEAPIDCYGHQRVWAYNDIKDILDTLEVKEINTWHLQKNEDIYDAVRDWSLHSFICLMDDGSVQKFTGIRCECADGSINTHVDATDDKYDTNNIVFWIETPL